MKKLKATISFEGDYLNKSNNQVTIEFDYNFFFDMCRWISKDVKKCEYCNAKFICFTRKTLND